MTAPVATRIVPGAGPNCESTFTVSFYIPPKHQDSPPTPTGEGVFIEEFPEMTVYARGFGGFAKEQQWIDEARELSEKVNNKNIQQEFYFTAGYDSPFKLFNRLNEVWFVKKWLLDLKFSTTSFQWICCCCHKHAFAICAVVNSHYIIMNHKIKIRSNKNIHCIVEVSCCFIFIQII